MFEKRVLRRIFATKMEKAPGDWRKLHLEEPHNVYSSPNIIRNIIKEDELYGTCSTHGRDDKCVQNFGRKNQNKETSLET
jgi:hypothetical protein